MTVLIAVKTTAVAPTLRPIERRAIAVSEGVRRKSRNAIRMSWQQSLKPDNYACTSCLLRKIAMLLYLCQGEQLEVYRFAIRKRL